MLEENITQKAGTSLLKLLKKHKCFTDLPQDSRSLLKTPRATAVEADINVVTPGKYCHFGLLDGLQQTLQGFEKLPSVANLYFNIDGLPISKSSKTQLWPIQCKLAKCELPPFIVGIYEGKTKPKCSNEFLSRFVSELKSVLADGVEVGAKVVKISVKGFVCDSPARAFVFMTKGHSGYNSCPKCTVEGSHLGRVCFPETAATLRTDQSFRGQEDPDHHHGVSVLTELPIDCVQCSARLHAFGLPGGNEEVTSAVGGRSIKSGTRACRAQCFV
ncbi:unnamed protein product [Ixodes persulcatus]